MKSLKAHWEPQNGHKASPLVVSFSGIDGAGKTTQIERLAAWLRESGLRVSLIRFWDDVAALRRAREALGHTLFKGEKGIGTPERPVRRRDKNVQSWYLLPVRISLYFLDALSLAFVFGQRMQTKEADVLIFDRYLYDELANLNANNRLVRAYIPFLLRLVRRPDVAYLLDEHPMSARARKPEYPLDFLRSNRKGYHQISKIAGMRVIAPGRPEEVEIGVRHEIVHKLTLIRDRIAAHG